LIVTLFPASQGEPHLAVKVFVPVVSKVTLIVSPLPLATPDQVGSPAGQLAPEGLGYALKSYFVPLKTTIVLPVTSSQLDPE